MARPSRQIPDWSALEPGFSLHFSYPVIFCRDVLNPENSVLARNIAGVMHRYANLAKTDEETPSEAWTAANADFSLNGDGSLDSRAELPARSTVEQHSLEMGPRPRCLFVVDQGLLQARADLLARIRQYGESHRDLFEMAASIAVLPGGEDCKNDLSHLTTLYQAVADAGIDRHSCIVGIGGGAFLDVVGFAAATAHRGLRLIRIPTTVLAQNDASVGVKNGMNFAGRKNFIGSFAPPYAVLNDFDLISTLSERDKRAGMAEAVKVALIRDGAFFQWLEAHSGQLARFEDWTLEHLIFRCAELHLHQISQGGDPFESGSARPLDFGHWAAHKLEGLSNHELRHGEAVAIGMALDTLYSMRSGLLSQKDGRRVFSLLQNLGFALYSGHLSDLPVESALQEFREHLGGQLCITLLRSCGEGVEVNSMDADLIRNCIRDLGRLQSDDVDSLFVPSRSLPAWPPRKDSRGYGETAANHLDVGPGH